MKFFITEHSIHTILSAIYFLTNWTGSTPRTHDYREIWKTPFICTYKLNGWCHAYSFLSKGLGHGCWGNTPSETKQYYTESLIYIHTHAFSISRSNLFKQCSDRILICTRIQHVSHDSHLIRNTQNRWQDMPAEHLSSTTQLFLRPLLLRPPPSWELPCSEHLLEHHLVVLEATPPASSKTSTTTDLIDFHLQFSKQDSLNSQSQLCH